MGRGEGEDDELGKLFFEMAVSLEQRGVLLDEARKRRLTQQVLCLRRQHAWLKRERDLCIEWNRGKSHPKQGPAFVDNLDLHGPRPLVTYEAVTRYLEDQLWPAYKNNESAQTILALDMQVNHTKKRQAEKDQRSRFGAYLIENGGGRRALRTKYVRVRQ